VCNFWAISTSPDVCSSSIILKGNDAGKIFLITATSQLLLLKNTCKELSAADLVRQGAALAVDGYLQGKLLHAFGTLFCAAKNSALAAAKNILAPMPAFEYLAQTAEGVQLNIVDEIFSCMAQESDKIKSGKSICNSKFIKVKNMHEFFETEFGKILKNKVINKNGHYIIVEKIKHPHIAKGDIFYLDQLHCDHLEVFRHGYSSCVLNLNGTRNIEKSIVAKGRVFKK
jgi:hypothetical protein